MRHRFRVMGAALVTLVCVSASLVLRAQQPAGRAPAAQQGRQGGAAPAGAAGSSPQAQRVPDQPTFRSGINFVTVDAYVTDSKGNAVTDLTQSDFEVFEDDKPQAIEQFRLVKVDGNPRPGDPPPSPIRNRDDEEREAARDDTRVFVIFLRSDEHTSELQSH